MRIDGRVARILGEDAIVINAGLAAGVTSGMRFAVYTELDEVPDPETGQSLGRLEAVKARVVAVHIQETMCTCMADLPPRAADLDVQDPTQRTLSAEMVALSMATGRKEPAKLDVDRSAITGRPRLGPIAVGDKVRSI